MRTFAFIIVCLLLCSCGNGNTQENGATSGNREESAPSVVDELPLPSVPGYIVEPQERAAFVLAHFWNAMDFGNHDLSLDSGFMEQNFVNFVSLFDYADSSAVAHGVRVLLDKAGKDERSFAFLTATADRYLRDPESPMYNEEHHAYFLRALLATDRLKGVEREKAEYNLDVAMKNSRGTRAADFRFVTREGRETRLSDFCREHGLTLLMFYDPDCESCSDVIARLSRGMVPEGASVLAIDAEGDRERWDNTRDAMPADWAVGYALDDIIEDELYVLPAMPVIYILDSSATVLAKDARL